MKGRTLHVLHGNKAFAIDFTDFVNVANERVIQGRCGAGFPQETMARGFITSHFFGKELQRHVTLENRIGGPVDFTHATFADLFGYEVMGDCLADHWSLPVVYCRKESRA